MSARRVRKVSGCENGTCPAVYVSDRNTAVVQGDWLPEAEGMTLGPGEAAVELPARIVLEAVSALATTDPEMAQILQEALACS
jgi:hypothetical protein